MARMNTAAGDVQAAQAALKKIAPPAHVELRDCDVPFWDAIIGARARETWTDIDLVHAANLARTQADIEKVQKELDVEGFTIVNIRGNVMHNPKFMVLETLSRRSVALAKALHVHANATVGDARDQVPKNKRQRKMVETNRDLDDDLIAQPVH